MNAITPFQSTDFNIRAVELDGAPWFVGKDIAEALGYKDTVNAIKQHCKGVAKHHPIIDSLGRNQEVRIINEPDMLRLIVNSTLPAAEKFERWVFEDVLPSIRKTGSYAAPQPGALPRTIDALKLAPLVVRAARALGLDKNAAALSANQAVAKLTGTNVLQLLGHQHLEAENQTALYFTPTELGERLGISARKFNMLLAESGLQVKKGESWAPLPEAEGFFRIMDTSKRHSDGTMVQQLKWAENVLALVEKTAA